MKKQIPLSALIKLISFYSLILGIIGTILVLGITLTKHSSNPSPTPTVTLTPTISGSLTNKGEGEMCGGIAGFQCADGYRCKFTCPNGSICDDSHYPYPDASGICVKE